MLGRFNPDGLREHLLPQRITLEPTAINLKKAEQHKEAIEHEISIGTFDYSVTFPESARSAKFAPETSRETVNSSLIRWLEGKRKHISSSTFDGYRKLVELKLIPALAEKMVVDLKRKNIRD
ncbi:Arm DNA-binding domain-containing protein [Pseudomonas protegens]|uniref:Arm DNA-binding domain-containing protein n=1 Tax=Pseudomonas protegens TaxID=380021 RepID=UPI002FCCD8B8